jgi:hypothetical protein
MFNYFHSSASHDVTALNAESNESYLLRKQHKTSLGLHAKWIWQTDACRLDDDERPEIVGVTLPVLTSSNADWLNPTQARLT